MNTLRQISFIVLFIFILIFELLIGIIGEFPQLRILPFLILLFYISSEKFSNSFVLAFFFSGIYYDLFYTSNYFALTNKTNCWIDLKYPEHHATIHITYKKINNNIFQLVEDSRNMVYKHTIKADAINEKTYLNKEHNTYGTLYDIQGETASSVQFHITDSVSNFIRGALYFHVNPNQDSLKPIINYLRADIIQIMESLQWDELNASLE